MHEQLVVLVYLADAVAVERVRARELLAVVGGKLARHDGGIVAALHVFLEGRAQLAQVHPHRVLQHQRELLRRPPVLQYLDHGVVAEVGGDVLDHRFALLVHHKGPLDPPYLFQLEQAIVEQSIAHEHVSARILPVRGEVLGHAFHEPQRRIIVAVLARLLHDLAQLLQHECVHHFVAGHVPEGGVLPGEGYGDTPLHEVGETARVLGDEIRENVGFLETVVGVVEDEGDTVPEIDSEHLAQLEVRLLHHGRHVEDQVGVAGIVVYIDVLGLENLPVAVLIDDLVLAEGVLRVRCGGNNERGEYECREKLSCHTAQIVISPSKFTATGPSMTTPVAPSGALAKPTLRISPLRWTTVRSSAPPAVWA